MSRTKLLQTRPELPSLEEILGDLESAPNDDVAFTFLRDYASGVAGILPGSNPMDEGQENKTARLAGESASIDPSAAKRPRQDPSKIATSSKQISEEHELQDTYLKVLRFLEMNSYLRDSQDAMAQQCSDLQELGQSVKDQIESLRTHLHSS